MKRSEMLEHMIADIEDALINLDNRPNTKPYFSEKLANNLLDMIEGFGMVPPGEVSEAGNVIYDWDKEDEKK